MKNCNICKSTDIELVKNKNICKQCQKIKNKNYSKLTKNKRYEYKKKYYERNKEKIIDYSITYKKNNYIKIILDTSKTKDKLKNRNNDLSIEFIEFLNSKQNNKCFYCSSNIVTSSKSLNSLSIDRLKNNIGHIKENTVLSCIFCNYSKNCMSFTMLKIFLNMLKGNQYDLIEENSNNWILNMISRLSKLKKYTNKKIEINKKWIENQYKL